MNCIILSQVLIIELVLILLYYRNFNGADVTVMYLCRRFSLFVHTAGRFILNFDM